MREKGGTLKDIQRGQGEGGQTIFCPSPFDMVY
jgi:hypothetical protein